MTLPWKRTGRETGAGDARRPGSSMKILVVSDVESKFLWEHFDPEQFRGVKLMISCGDLKASYLSYLVTMIPAPLFYVYGNHDGGYDRNPPQGCECIDGRVVEFQGLRIGGLGGCMGTDPNNSYQYTEAQMEKRVKKLGGELKKAGGLDIFVSHAPSKGVGDSIGFHEGFECFNGIHRDYGTRLHLYGHLHVNTNPGAKTGVYESGNTRFVNCTGYRVLDLSQYL